MRTGLAENRKRAAQVALFLLILASAAHAQPASGQFKCDAPTTNKWLLPLVGSGKNEEVDVALVYPVQKDVERAIGLLDNQSAIPLTPAQLTEFGVKASSYASARRAYLVRAVYPVPRPKLAVSWVGKDLHVFANGLGCAPFVKRPLVILLDRKPRRVFVTAAAAL